jgi:hypothetical protein
MRRCASCMCSGHVHAAHNGVLRLACRKLRHQIHSRLRDFWVARVEAPAEHNRALLLRKGAHCCLVVAGQQLCGGHVRRHACSFPIATPACGHQCYAVLVCSQVTPVLSVAGSNREPEKFEYSAWVQVTRCCQHGAVQLLLSVSSAKRHGASCTLPPHRNDAPG